MFNDKVNAATAELAARKQITRAVLQEDKEVILTEWTDDMFRRDAAIDRLVGLARETPTEARRIARLLCAYVKDLSREYPADPVPELSKDKDISDYIDRAYEYSEVADWVETLKVKRDDAEQAVRSLSRINTLLIEYESGSENDPVIQLQNCNLQVMDLSKLDLRFARLNRAHIQNAVFSESDLRNANLSRVNAHSAKFNRTNLDGVHMGGANFMLANLSVSSVQNAVVVNSTFQHVTFSMSVLRDTHIHASRMFDVNLKLGSTNRLKIWDSELCGLDIGPLSQLAGLELHRVALKYVRFQENKISPEHITQLFGDATVLLPAEIDRPQNWPDIDLVYKPRLQDSSPFHIEWNAWKQNPDTYDWAARRHMYTTDGRLKS